MKLTGTFFSTWLKTIYGSLKHKIHWHYTSPHSIIRIGMGKSCMQLAGAQVDHMPTIHRLKL